MLESLIDTLGDGTTLFAGGFLVGVLFGAAANYSRFCMRAATIEFTGWTLGPRMTVWLLAFFAAVTAVQFSVWQGWIVLEDTRQIGGVGSVSGAMIGGLLFGIGMILARGCASRLLVLSAAGNLRALLTGLILTIVAQASLRGVLSGPRSTLAQIWTVEAGAGRDLLAFFRLDTVAGVLVGLIGLAGTLYLARRNRQGAPDILAAILVGVAVAVGWIFTFAMSGVSFEPVAPSSVTFTGPSADTLMGLVNAPAIPLTFETGLIPGVFFGSAVAAVVTRSWKLEGFQGGQSMIFYILGAICMGFGAMLAGGCAVGAGVTGGALLATTALIALTFMWAGAVLANLLLNGQLFAGQLGPRQS